MSDVLEGDLEQRKYSQLDYKYRGGGLAVWFHPSPSTRLTILKSLLPSQKPTSLSSNIKRNFFFVFPDTEEFISSRIYRDFFLVVTDTQELLPCHTKYREASYLSSQIHNMNFFLVIQDTLKLLYVIPDNQEPLHCHLRYTGNYSLSIPDTQKLLPCHPR